MLVAYALQVAILLLALHVDNGPVSIATQQDDV